MSENDVCMNSKSIAPQMANLTVNKDRHTEKKVLVRGIDYPDILLLHYKPQKIGAFPQRLNCHLTITEGFPD